MGIHLIHTQQPQQPQHNQCLRSMSSSPYWPILIDIYQEANKSQNQRWKYSEAAPRASPCILLFTTTHKYIKLVPGEIGSTIYLVMRTGSHPLRQPPTVLRAVPLSSLTPSSARRAWPGCSDYTVKSWNVSLARQPKQQQSPPPDLLNTTCTMGRNLKLFDDQVR